MRVDAIQDIDIIISNHKLEILTEGVIKGLQMIIESNSDDLNFNENLLMDISSNKIGNNHHILMYGLNGSYLESGEYTLFESNENYKILEFLAANSNNTIVENNYKNNIVEPNVFDLKQNYPNPFNPSTKIEIELGVADNVSLIVYDINGRQVKQLANGFYGKGIHEFTWNSRDDYGNIVSSGMYIYRLVSSSQVATQKMLLLK
tara:strand:- start:4299 stop:4910 length:612 start_codon:yes stop_codon:yes gene_type:complete